MKPFDPENKPQATDETSALSDASAEKRRPLFAGLKAFGLLLPRPAITTVEDWRAFVNQPPAVRPERISYEDYKRLEPSSRRRYDAQRIQYHASFGPLETPLLKRFHDDALRLADVNYRAAPGARPGLVLDGLGSVGKSTIATQLGRSYERLLRRKLDLPGELPNKNRFIPVVYLSLTGNVTIKGFNWQIIEYFNVPAVRSATEDWLNRQIIRHAKDCGTTMVIVDDIHFLKLGSKNGVTINNHLKYLASSISATFVYAGINLDGTQLLSEGFSEQSGSSQTRRRFRRYEVAAYRRDSHDYKSLLMTFEDSLVLLKQPEKRVSVQLADYIYKRTSGYIGAMSSLLREGANLAIEQGAECLTTQLLNKVRLDLASEEQLAKERRPARKDEKRADS